MVKLNPAGSAIEFGTLLGGSLVDGGRAIALDDTGVYITGRTDSTDSTDFPVTPDAYDTGYNSGDDAFVAKLALDLTGLFYATFLGGSNGDQGEDLAVDAAGSVYVTGSAYSDDFPTTPDAFAQSCPGCSPYYDTFVAKINPNGTGLVYSTYLGGTDHDQSFGLVQDGMGYVYVTGDTKSLNFPTTAGAFDTTLNGYGKGFVTKLFVGTEVGPPPPSVPEHHCGPTLLDTLTVQTEPRGLVLDTTRQRLYVANFGSDSVSVIDTTNDNVLQTISGVDSANGVTFDPTRNLIWVTNYNSGQVTPIQANSDATDFSAHSAVNVGNRPWGVIYDPVHDYVYVVNHADDSVSVIDAGTQTLVTTLSDSFNRPFHLAVNPSTGKVYVANSGHNTSSVTVIDGTTVSRVIELGDSIRASGIAVDETRDLVYVATTYSNRIIVIGELNGQADQFLGWAAFQRGYDRKRPIPLRAIAVNPQMGPTFDGGHVWATTATLDGSEANQVLLIPKGWSSRFHVPFTQNVGGNPTEGTGVDRTTNRVYVTGGIAPGLVTVLGDHAAICGGMAPATVSDESSQITFDLYSLEMIIRSDVNKDDRVDIFDLSRVASRYGSSDSSADVNGDGTVDIFDLTIVAGNYGQKLPIVGQ